MSNKKIVMLRSGVYVVNSDGETSEAKTGVEVTVDSDCADKLIKKGFALSSSDYTKKINLSADNSEEVEKLKSEIESLKKDNAKLKKEVDAFKAAK